MKARGSDINKAGWKVDLTSMQIVKNGIVIAKLKLVTNKDGRNNKKIK